MVLIRHRTVLLMACAIAGVVGLASSAWAQDTTGPLVVLQYPQYLSSLVIGQTSGGQTTVGVDLAADSAPDNFGGLAVSSGSFAYYSPSQGTWVTGQQGIFDAIVDGGNSVGGGNATYQGISSSYASASNGALFGQGIVGFLDNDGTGPATYTNNWRGLSLVGLPATTLISPTWVGDSELRGYVSTDDLGNWLTGYDSNGFLTGWDWGNFAYEPTVTTDSLGNWLTTYDANLGEFPNFGLPLPSAVPAGVGAVPEPATFSLLAAAALAAVVFGLRRRRSAS